MQLLLIIAFLALTIALLPRQSKQNAVSEVMQKQDNYRAANFKYRLSLSKWW